MKLILTKQGKDKVYDIDYLATHTEPGKLTIKIKGAGVKTIDGKDWQSIRIEKE